FRTSPIGKLYPSKGFSERKTHPSPDPVLNAGMEEILEDAEDMLGIRRLQSAIALFEQAILRCPHYSAYPHLRLLEMYYDLDRREDFERVAPERFLEMYIAEQCMVGVAVVNPGWSARSLSGMPGPWSEMRMVLPSSLMLMTALRK
ncbi:MAG: hypothetical protein K6U07_03495, partial [Firmicutes bacterium]|nr:hypothetical protein [Bacillota bacterium]